MNNQFDESEFQLINRAYNSTFQPGRLSLGLVVPLENYTAGPVPTMTRHVERVQLAEELGFSAIWLRDVPFNVPSFGDAGQMFDPFVYLGLLAGKTERIALATGSIVLPLRHPAHVAKASASVDVLSGGRLILGVASGDRPEEYPALNLPFSERGDRFRASFDYIRRMWEDAAAFENTYGSPDGGMDMLPKPTSGKLPMTHHTAAASKTPTGSRATARAGSPIHAASLRRQESLPDWRERVKACWRPLTNQQSQSLYVDLADDPDAPPQPIHLGFRSGANPLRAYLESLQEIGVNHVATEPAL